MTYEENIGAAKDKYKAGVSNTQAVFKKHSIKVDDGVYRALLKEQRTRETFADVIKRLVEFYEAARECHRKWLQTREELKP